MAKLKKVFFVSSIVALISFILLNVGYVNFIKGVDLQSFNFIPIVGVVVCYVIFDLSFLTAIGSGLIFFIVKYKNLIKKIILSTGFFLLKIIYYSLLEFVLPEKKLWHTGGVSTLNPFAPYSYGGMPRKKFLVLYRRMKNGVKVSCDDYQRAKWGSLNPSREEFIDVCNREDLMEKRFSFR